MAAELLTIGHNVETYREAAAKRIKQLMHDWTANTLTLGAELMQARDTFAPHPKRTGERPGFEKWAVQTTGLARGHINTLLRIHQKFGGRSQKHRLAQQVMALLAAENVPESARQEALDRSARGEHVTDRDAKKIIKVHKLPTAKDANAQAKEEGRPVLARDGYIYFGTDPSRAKEGESRRTMVYGVRKALDTLGGIRLTGREFLTYAFPHQLWNKQEAAIIKRALHWLIDLDKTWDRWDSDA